MVVVVVVLFVFLIRGTRNGKVSSVSNLWTQSMLMNFCSSSEFE